MAPNANLAHSRRNDRQSHRPRCRPLPSVRGMKGKAISPRYPAPVDVGAGQVKRIESPKWMVDHQLDCPVDKAIKARTQYDHGPSTPQITIHLVHDRR